MMTLQVRQTNIPKLRFPEFKGEWEEKKMLDVAPLQRGFDLPTSDVIEGDIPVVYSNGILRTHNEYKVKAPGVVTGRSGTIGKVTFVEEDYWPHNTSLWVTDFKENEPKYIFYLYNQINLEKYNAGSTVPTLNRNDVHIVKVKIPKRPEQQKIASFLGAVDDKIAGLQKKKDLLEGYKKGMMQRLFSQSFRFTDANGNPFPDWEEKKLGDIGQFTSGTGFSESEQGGKSGIPFLKVSDMNLLGNESVITTANHYVSNEQIQRLRYKPIKQKSIIFAKVGAAVFLERKRLASNFLIDNNMMAFIPAKDAVIEFLKIVFDMMRLSKYAQTGALPSYNAGDLKTIKIKTPHIDEQKKIADFLSAIDDKIALVADELSHAKTFKKGLLQQMFV